MFIDADGVPAEFQFHPESVADIEGIKSMTLELGKGAILLGDKAYTDVNFEQILRDRKNALEGYLSNVSIRRRA